MNLRTSRLPVALLVVALTPALAACGSSANPAGQGAAASAATVTVTAAKGCSIDHTDFKAGGIDFSIKNVDATTVSEVEVLSGDRIIGEKENLPPGFSGTFSISVPAGDYTLYCPGAATEKTALKVTGTSAVATDTTSALLAQATTGYAKYVDTQVGYLLTNVKKLRSAIASGNVAAGQVAYAKARPFYEKIEPVAESFTIGSNSLDADIDARINDVPASQFMGFHRIEQGLFADKSVKGLMPYADGLVTNVAKLQRLTKGLKYQPTELANGAQELLDEVAASKITGEEERYSHIDLLDMANNIEGSEQAFAQLQPALTKINPALTQLLTTRFTALDTLMDKYRDTAQPSGYVLYGMLNGAEKRQLAAAIKAVQEPLSQVASKVAR